jgi:hypothetical protein
VAVVRFDPRFTTLHPRTALWWVQREQCRQCDRMLVREDRRKRGDMGMDCAARPEAWWDGNKDRSCITMRDVDSPCGPGAALFKPKE